MASYLAIQLVMTVSLLSPSMSGNVRIRWKISSVQHYVPSRHCLAKFGSAETIIWSIRCLISPSMPSKVRICWKLSSGQYGVLSCQCLAKFGSAENYHQVNTVILSCQCRAMFGSAEKYHQVNTVSFLVLSVSGNIRSAEKTPAVQDGQSVNVGQCSDPLKNIIWSIRCSIPSMSGKVRICWKLSSGQYSVLSGVNVLQSLDPLKIIVWSIRCPCLV